MDDEVLLNMLWDLADITGVNYTTAQKRAKIEAVTRHIASKNRKLQSFYDSHLHADEIDMSDLIKQIKEYKCRKKSE